MVDSPISTGKTALLERVNGSRPPSLSTSQQGIELWNLIFQDDDWLPFRPIETYTEGSQKRSQVLHKKITCRQQKTIRNIWLEDFLKDIAKDYGNAFYGVCPRVGPRGYDQAWQIRVVRCLWLDLDNCGSIEDFLRRIEAAGLPHPSAIVKSGHGFHAYWKLVEAYLVDDVGIPPQIKKTWVEVEGKRKPIEFFDQGGERIYLKDPKTGRPIRANIPELSPKALFIQDIIAGIAAVVGGDATQDLSRLLRIPGSMNFKNARNGQTPIPCELVELTGEEFPHSAFERFAKESPNAKRREKVARVKLPPERKITATRQDRLNSLILACDTAEIGDRSEADFAICCWAVEHGIPAEELWSQISEIGKFAGEGRRYFDITMAKAKSKTQEKLFENSQRKQGRRSEAHRDQNNGSNQPVEATDTRIEIEITPDEYIVNEQAAESLARDQDTFQRGGILVHVTKDEGPTDGIARPKGSSRIIPLREELIRERLTKHAEFYRIKTTKEGDEIRKQDHPPSWCSKAVMSRGHWPGIRPLEGIVTHPILRPDGTVLNTPGYDPSMGLIFSPSEVFPEIEESPSREAAVSSLAYLEDLVCDFPFLGGEHRSTWLAYLLTPFARFAFSGPVPMFLIDANVRGSGKSLLADLVAIILTGERAPRMSNPKNDEEARKLITSLVLLGDLLILIDNVEGYLGCSALDAALTGTVWKDRILGRSEIVEMPLRMVWAASGNNIVLKADTTRRVAHIRLQSDWEKPEERSDFKYPNILQHALQNRSSLIAAALTVLRAYCHAGRPDIQLKPWGSFEGWSDLVRNALVWCGHPDPAQAREELTSEADSEGMSLSALLHSWHEIDPENEGIKTAQILKKLEDDKDGKCSSFREALLELCPTKGNELPSIRAIGNRFKHFKGRIAHGKALNSRSYANFQFWSVRDIQREADSTDSNHNQDFESVEQFESESVANACEKKFPGTENENDICKGPKQTQSVQQTQNPKITHKQPGCGSRHWWQHDSGGYYCLDCWPTTDPATVIRTCED